MAKRGIRFMALEDFIISTFLIEDRTPPTSHTRHKTLLKEKPQINA